jgi:hypothetical protein
MGLHPDGRWRPVPPLDRLRHLAEHHVRMDAPKMTPAGRGAIITDDSDAFVT